MSICPAAPRFACRRMVGASFVAAGVAAQYLSLNPGATPKHVLEALVAMSTPDAVTGLGSAAVNRLLFSNLTEPLHSTGGLDAENPAASAGSGSGSPPTVAIVAPVVAVGKWAGRAFFLEAPWPSPPSCPSCPSVHVFYFLFSSKLFFKDSRGCRSRVPCAILKCLDPQGPDHQMSH
jgi:hypothetical protein